MRYRKKSPWIYYWPIKKTSSLRLVAGIVSLSVTEWIFQLKNEYKGFLTRKIQIEKDLVEVEKQELELRWVGRTVGKGSN